MQTSWGQGYPAEIDILKKACSKFAMGNYLCAVVLLACLVAGCTTSRVRTIWGDDVDYSPGWRRVVDAARGAASDPQTWIPAAGAALFISSNLDHEVSEWAKDKTPIFGSKSGADNAGDYLVGTLAGAYLVTSLATPASAEENAWAEAKMKGLSVGVSSSVVNYGATVGLKGVTGRDRPDGSDRRSFPSGHSSSGAVFYALASRNIDFFDISERDKRVWRTGLATLALGTAWSRVEADKHFPSDVLAGLALGHFLGVFFHDAFLHNWDVVVSFTPALGGARASISWPF